MAFFLSTLEQVGAYTIGTLEFWGRIALMVAASVRSAVVDRWHAMRATLRVIAAQTYFTGWQAMPLVFLLASVTGATLVFYTANQTSPLGGGDVGTTLLYLLVGRELGPLITGLVVIARSGSAVASEIGNMRANGEIEALRVMAIEPLSFVVFPRLVGGVVSVVCLVVYFDLIAFASAFVTENLLSNVPFTAFAMKLVQQLETEDVLLVVLKSLLTGFTIFSVSTYQGLQVQRSPHEVPQVTTRAVVVNIVTVTLINFVLTAVALLRHFQGTQL